MNTVTKRWMGPAPTHCDLCCAPITKVFIDGRTVHGCWANMCEACHSQVGVGLGTGKGQKYDRDGESWIKVAG